MLRRAYKMFIAAHKNTGEGAGYVYYARNSRVRKVASQSHVTAVAAIAAPLLPLRHADFCHYRARIEVYTYTPGFLMPFSFCRYALMPLMPPCCHFSIISMLALAASPADACRFDIFIRAIDAACRRASFAFPSSMPLIREKK